MDIPQADLDLLNEKDKAELRTFISNETQRQRIQGRMYTPVQHISSPDLVLYPSSTEACCCPSINESKPTYLLQFPLPSIHPSHPMPSLSNHLRVT